MREKLIECRDIVKSFGGIRALDHISLDVEAGEIHAMAGENGAGKSTLMKILAGALSMDHGNIFMEGKEVRFRSPSQALASGIRIVYQELSLIPDLTVAENVMIHTLGRGSQLIPWSRISRQAAERIRRLGFEIAPGKKAGSLSLAEQQVVEIARALDGNARVLILDEPTAVLSPAETDALFAALRRYREVGGSVLYISHRMEELVALADRITILKDGKKVTTVWAPEASPELLIRHMLGRNILGSFPGRKRKPSEALLRAQSLGADKHFQDISFVLHSGEILGLAGLVGSGRTEILRALFGAGHYSNGAIVLDGKKHRKNSMSLSVNRGMGMVPEDRKQEGVLTALSVKQNLGLTAPRIIAGRTGFIRRRAENSHGERILSEFGIKTSGLDAPVHQLSGGNQQKVALAKWIGPARKVLLLDEPTRGVDVGAKEEIYRLICSLADRGMGILLVSSDLPELMGLSDRIMVVHRGRIRSSYKREEFSEALILSDSFNSEQTHDEA